MTEQIKLEGDFPIQENITAQTLYEDNHSQEANRLRES